VLLSIVILIIGVVLLTQKKPEGSPPAQNAALGAIRASTRGKTHNVRFSESVGKGADEEAGWEMDDESDTEADVAKPGSSAGAANENVGEERRRLIIEGELPAKDPEEFGDWEDGKPAVR